MSKRPAYSKENPFLTDDQLAYCRRTFTEESSNLNGEAHERILRPLDLLGELGRGRKSSLYCDLARYSSWQTSATGSRFRSTVSGMFMDLMRSAVVGCGSGDFAGFEQPNDGLKQKQKERVRSSEGDIRKFVVLSDVADGDDIVVVDDLSREDEFADIAKDNPLVNFMRFLSGDLAAESAKENLVLPEDFHEVFARVFDNIFAAKLSKEAVDQQIAVGVPPGAVDEFSDWECNDLELSSMDCQHQMSPVIGRTVR